MRGPRRSALPVVVLALAAAASAGSGAATRALVSSGTISGTVTDSHGAPLANVTVVVEDTNEGQTVGTTETDVSGHYVVAPQFHSPSLTFTVHTHNNLGYIDKLYDDVLCFGSFGCNTMNGTPLTILNGGTLANINLSLPAGGRIAGIVTNAQNGIPASGISIKVYSAIGDLLTAATTGGNGLYQTPALPPGMYFVSAIGWPNLGNQLYSGVGCGGCNPTLGTPVIVTAGGVVGNINFALPGSGSITGIVTAEADGSPIQNVMVEAVGADGQVFSYAFTNASGGYTIDFGLGGSASYYVRTKVNYYLNLPLADEIYPGLACGACLPPSGGTLVPVATGATTGNINFALAVGGRISGHMVSGSVTPPVLVFNASNVLMGQAFYQIGGIYATPVLPPGTYYLRTVDAFLRINELYDNFPCLGPDCIPIAGTPVTVTAGNTTLGIDFDLAQGGVISGTVKSPGGVRLRNVTVELFSSTGRLLGSTLTGATGGYSLPAAPDGTYYLRAQGGHLGLGDRLFDNVSCSPACDDVTIGTPVVVSGGGNQTGKDFTLASAGSMSGIVRDANTLSPLPSRVQVFAATGVLVKSAIANANGFFGVPGLAPGTYYARTVNTLGYKDKIFNNVAFCDPGCDVTDGAPITVTAGSETTGVSFDLVAGTEMLQNAGFSNGLANWSLFATPNNNYLVWQVLFGAFRYYRANPPPGTSNSAVILQNTNVALGSGDPVLLQFDLANTSDARKRISVLVHDGSFSDLAVCTYWLPPNMGVRRYGMRTHPTQSWTNASVSLYAASADSLGGFYQIDNVTMQVLSNADISETQCIDPMLPAASGGAAGPELLVNGDFSTGNTQGWTLFGQITSQVTGGVFEFIRPSPNSDPAGVILQPTGTAAASGERFTAHFELGNSSSARKRVTVLLHDFDFSDLTACTFWLEPGQPLSQYSMLGYATKPWTNATMSVYAATAGNETWMRLDNVSLKKTPSAKTVGTGCFEPGSNQPAAAPGGGDNGVAPATFASSISGSGDASRAAGGGPAYILEAATGGVGTPETTLDLTEAATGTLSFESRFPGGEAGARVEVSVDAMPWQTLAEVPPSDDWLTLTFDLSPYAGHELRVRFVLDAGAADAGDIKRWQIRNVVLIPTGTPRIGFRDLLRPGQESPIAAW